MAVTQQGWDPETYDAFRGLRLRPALDLLSAIGNLPEGDVIDLGCGSGAAGPALRAAYPDRQLIGLDNAPEMLSVADTTDVYDTLSVTDIATWEPGSAPALIFTNAVLQWLPDHAALVPRLAQMLASGGWLAIQMPGQNDAPSHAAYRALSDRDADGPGIALPQDYEAWLAPLGAVRVWETSYYQHLPAWSEGHPVRAFTLATYGRPFLRDLTPAETDKLNAAYDREMSAAYPLRPDGSVLFPFRRVFVLFCRDTLQRG